MGRIDERLIDRDDKQAAGTSADDGDRTDRIRSCDDSNEESQAEPTVVNPAAPHLASRVLVTWIELTVVGITGGLLGAAVGGPPGFIIYLSTTLLTVGIIFYNVNELVREWVQDS